MTMRRVAPIGTCALALAFVVAGTTGLAGQHYEAPKTAWGDPDLQGVWSNNTLVPLQRPDEIGDRETLSDEEVAARLQAKRDRLFTKREGSTGFYNEFWYEFGLGLNSNRASLITHPADGKLPALTASAEQRAEELTAIRRRSVVAPDHYLDMTTYDRCISHGRWEGDTLVVETTNFTEKLDERNTFVPSVFASGANQRLIERFTRVSEDVIDYRLTVEDPTVFTGEWTAAIPFNRFDGTLFEYACHEGNYALPNMLAGARATEAAAAAGGVQ